MTTVIARASPPLTPAPPLGANTTETRSRATERRRTTTRTLSRRRTVSRLCHCPTGQQRNQSEDASRSSSEPPHPPLGANTCVAFRGQARDSTRSEPIHAAPIPREHRSRCYTGCSSVVGREYGSRRSSSDSLIPLWGLILLSRAAGRTEERRRRHSRWDGDPEQQPSNGARRNGPYPGSVTSRSRSRLAVNWDSPRLLGVTTLEANHVEGWSAEEAVGVLKECDRDEPCGFAVGDVARTEDELTGNLACTMRIVVGRRWRDRYCGFELDDNGRTPFGVGVGLAGGTLLLEIIGTHL